MTNSAVPNILTRDSAEAEPSKCILKWEVSERVRYEVIPKDSLQRNQPSRPL